jgi:uncharacterized LabA/DUF88 family protein
MLFIDGTHIDKRCQQAFNRTDIDYRAFFGKLSVGTRLTHVLYCAAPYRGMEMRGYQRGVLNRMKSLGIVSVFEGRYMDRSYKCNKCGYCNTQLVEKGTDVGVAAHLLDAAYRKLADQLILVSGDNDYWPALHLAAKQGAHCRFAYFIGPDESDFDRYNEVAMLRNNCRGYIKLNDGFMADCWYRKPA